jgi:endonuclease-8
VPEGDTIFRAASTLHRVLAGHRVVTCESPLAAVTQAAFAGHVVTKVEARGKNLLIVFDDGRVLHTHMRMDGSWHVYRIGERWFKKTEAARVVLTTADMVAVCFSAPVVRVLAASTVERDRHVGELGPDLLGPTFDLDRARANIRAEPGREIGDALMQQRQVAGIGNVYKSETLFICRVDPFVKVSALDDATLDRLLLEARKLLQRNVRNAGPRTTRAALAGPRCWVYLRAREACLVCRGPVEMRRQGAPARSTYFCARCQGVT